MKTPLLTLPALALVVLPVAGALADQEAGPEKIEARAPDAGLELVLDAIRKLTAKVERLEKTVDSLRKEIALLRSKREEDKPAGRTESPLPERSFLGLPKELKALLENKLPGANADSSVPFQSREANLVELAKVKLPDDPDENAVARYVDRILELSRSQNSCSTSDPQSRMLARVGPDHVPLLLDRLLKLRSGFGFPNDRYLVGAINALATEEHRDRIIELLSLQPGLVEVVHQHGWHEEARFVLISELLNPFIRYFSSEWISATAKLGDSESRAAMITAFAAGKDDVVAFYSELSTAPAIELDALVGEMWKAREARAFDPNVERAARIAARHGIGNALARLFADLTTLDGWSLRETRSTIYHCTGATGTPEELQAWFRENGDQLEWDTQKRKWIAPPPAKD